MDSPSNILCLGLPIFDSISGRRVMKSSNNPFSTLEFFGVNSQTGPYETTTTVGGLVDDLCQ
jgi:hypothetical protein